MVKRKEFGDVSFEHYYPQASVADHEVFMAFVNDDDAENFRNWWGDEGSHLFQKWLDNQEGN